MSELYTFDALKRNFPEKQWLHCGDSKKGINLFGLILKKLILMVKLIFKSTGIFYLDENGFKRQGYMYQTRYLVDKYGLPKFHIFECETIRIF